MRAKARLDSCHLRRFYHRALLDPLAEGATSMVFTPAPIPKVIGFDRLYELTGGRTTEPPRALLANGVNKRSFVTGKRGRWHFFPTTDFARHLGSAKTMETCCTHNMLKLTRALFAHDPSAVYADYYERALYNGILASQDPDSGMMTYFQPTRPGYLKLYCTPYDSFWCCTGSGMENHAKYGDSVYFHDAESLYVNLFISSSLNWKEKRLKITQITRFPDEEFTRFSVALQKPIKLSLNIRHPSWCQEMTININGVRWSTSQLPGRYVAVERVWHNGDTLEVKLPMALRVESLPGRPDVVAMLYGPIVLAGRLGEKGLTPRADIIVNERTVGDVLKTEVEVPRLVGDAAEIMKRVKRSAGASLAFHTNGIGVPHDVSLIPYFRIAHERYTIYWETQKTG